MTDKTKGAENAQSTGSTVPPERVKVFEQKKAATPIWMWLLPLLLVLGLGAWFLSRTHTPAVTTTGHSLGYVNFDTDKATLTTDSQATLNHAADLMQQNSNMHLRIQGFTDSTGDSAHNVALSNQRSEAVTQYLTSKGIDRSRLSPEGFGEAAPIASNATSDGKAENRRVELFEQ